MNLTENEIRALPLVAKQKLVIELKAVKPGDKDYPNAKAVIELITSDKKYKAPELVRATALQDITVDGATVTQGQVVELFPWQHTALARFFEAAGRVTAALLLLACLTLGAFAQSAYTAYQIVGPSTATNASVFTNYIAGTTGATTNYNVPYTNSTVTTNVSVIISNGTPVFSTANTTNTVITYPNTINVTKFDAFSLHATANLSATASTNGTIVAGFSVSPDNVLWQTNAFTLSMTANSVTPVGVMTNLSFQSYGWIRLDYCSNNNTQSVTNLVVEVVKKPVRAGP